MDAKQLHSWVKDLSVTNRVTHSTLVVVLQQASSLATTLEAENTKLKEENALLKDAQTIELAKVGTDEEVVTFLQDDKYYHTKEEKRAGVIINNLQTEIAELKETIGQYVKLRE